MTSIEVIFGDYMLEFNFDFDKIQENMNTAKNRIKKVKKLLKIIDDDEDKHRNWLALNKNHLEFLRLKQTLYTSICGKRPTRATSLRREYEGTLVPSIVNKISLKKTLPTLKNRFITTLNDVLEIYEEGLKVMIINEGQYLELVNDIKVAYDFNIDLINTIEFLNNKVCAEKVAD